MVLQALGVSGALEDAPSHGMAGSVVLGFDHAGFVGCLPDLEAVRSVAKTVWGGSLGEACWGKSRGDDRRGWHDRSGVF